MTTAEPGDVYVFRVAGDGTLTVTQTLKLGLPTLIGGDFVFGADLRTLYLSLRGSVSKIRWFDVDPVSGSLTPKGTIDAGNVTNSLAISKDGRFLYVADWLGADVSAFGVSLDTGDLTKIGTYPFGSSLPNLTVVSD